MNKYVHWIPADTSQPITVEMKGSAPAFEKLQEYVGGYVEYVTVLFKGKTASMVVNEEGAITGLPVNKRATQIYYALSRQHGYEPTDPKSADQQKKDYLKSRGLSEDTKVYTLGPSGTPMIYGDVLVLEGITPS